MHYSIRITETASDNSRQEKTVFNRFTTVVKTKKDIATFLSERYGKVPSGRKKIYIDTPFGQQAVGFIHSYWNQDFSHNTPKYHQSDWVEITEVKESYVLLEEVS